MTTENTITGEEPAPAADTGKKMDRYVRRVEFVDSTDTVGCAPVHVTAKVLLDGHDVTPLLFLPWTAPGGTRVDLGPWWPYYTDLPYGIEITDDAVVIITLDLIADITAHPWREGPGGVQVTEDSVFITCPDGAVLEPLLEMPPPGRSHAEQVRLPIRHVDRPEGLAHWVAQGANRIRLRMFAGDVVFRPKSS